MQIAYKATNTASRFHHSEADYRLMVGPVGCGKSVACMIEILKLAMQQEPADDGMRYSRAVLVRNTYPELKSTTLQTWLEWFPEEAYGAVRYDSPLKHHIRVGDVDLQVWFVSMDKPKDVKKFLSMEMTYVYLNEMSEMPKAIFDAASQRVGRYPNGRKGAPTRPCIISDTNPPDEDHWAYKLFEEKRPDGFEVFHYVPALIKLGEGYIKNPEADWHKNIKDQNYYERMVRGKTDQWINIYVMGQYGHVADGKPVYPEYSDRIHFDADLKPIPDVPVMLCWDFGLTPCCVLIQLTPNGQIRVIKEWQATSSGIKQFAENVVKPDVAKLFGQYTFDVGQADPAGNQRAQTDEFSCIGVLNEIGGTFAPFKTEAASTNNFEPRRNAVASMLTKLTDGEPCLTISSACHIIRKGFLGNYRHKRVQVVGEERYRDEPDKANLYSHLQDALQYGCLKYASHSNKPIDDDFIKDFYSDQPTGFFSR